MINSLLCEFMSKKELSNSDFNLLSKNNILPDLLVNEIFTKKDTIESYYESVQKIINNMLKEKKLTYFEVLLYLVDKKLCSFKDKNIRKYFNKEIFISTYVAKDGHIEECESVINNKLININIACTELHHLEVKLSSNSKILSSNSKILISPVTIKFSEIDNKVIAIGNKKYITEYIAYLQNNIDKFVLTIQHASKHVIDKVLERDRKLIEVLKNIIDNDCKSSINNFINYDLFDKISLINFKY